MILILFPKPMLLTKIIMMLSLGISLALQIFEVRFQSPDFVITQYQNINWVGAIIILIVVIASIITLKISPKIFITFLSLGILIIIGIPNIWNGVMTDYQKQRVLTYFEGPESDPTGSGYQIIQSKIAIGSGMLTGRGYLQGTQSSLQVLTQSFTDFAFAAYAEQFGFIGVIILLFIYFLLLLRILRVARNSRNEFGKYVALGICLLLFLHIFINIGMNMGLLPVTGIPLPLISYGGSATVMILICLGLVQSVQSSQRSVDIANNLMVTSRSLLMN
jgi:rod shape determining protein RodA